MNFNNLNWQPPISYSEPNPEQERTKGIPMEDWLRGCVYHDGRNGEVTLPTDKVLEIANYIQATRTSITDISLMDKIERKDIEHLVRACVMVTEMIQDAPSVVPSGETGKWKITINEDYRCDNCGLITSSYKANYCPNCGAYMRGDTE